MTEKEEVVSLKDAVEQVKTAVRRIALIHLGFSRTLVKEFGEEKGKELIIKSMVEYGKLVGEQTKKGHQDLPCYGLHDKYAYSDKEFTDTRKSPVPRGKGFDFSQYKVYGCGLANTLLEFDEEDLGRLYCYVDSAKSMAADPNRKLIHTACELCGDGYCSFDLVPTTEEERENFANNTEDWKTVDPILVDGSDSKG